MAFSSVPGTALAATAAADRQAFNPPTHIVSSKADFSLLPLILPVLLFLFCVCCHHHRPAVHVQCDWFVDVTWVDAAGTIHTSVRGSAEAEALCGGLGLLGTLTEFTLQMTETTNTWFSTWCAPAGIATVSQLAVVAGKPALDAVLQHV